MRTNWRLNCHDCPYNVDSFTSPECGKSESIQGRRKFEINVRAVVAFREVGKGHESMINISRCLNMYVITETTYAALNQSLYQAYQEAADNSMQLSSKRVLKYFGISNGYCFDLLSEKRDKERVDKSIKKTESQKEN